MENKKITGSEAVILSLLQENVDVLFGYVGGAIMPIYDALYDYQNKLKHVLTRHEQGAVHAAQGYARITGITGVCFATSGPGATNLITSSIPHLWYASPVRFILRCWVAMPFKSKI
jgi:acetolactate synthase-1/2/3 large subunit